jgi:hypothetical protein
MKHTPTLSPILFTALLAAAGTTLANQPPDVVQSDKEQNTAMGSQVLTLLTSGAGNTAAGAGALFANTTGSSNTAFGWGTLVFAQR